MNARPMILAGVAVAMAALMLVPSAVAQGNPQLKVQITPLSGAIAPEIASKQLQVHVEWTPGNPAQPLASAQNGQVAITFVPDCPNGIRVTGPAQEFITVAAQDTQAKDVDVTFSVSVPRTAPGLATLQCKLKTSASALMTTTVPAVPERSDPFDVQVGYYSLNQVKVATKLKQAGPQKQVPFELEVTNFGNARTAYLFELGDGPSGKWNQLLPEVLLLDSPNSGQGSNVNTAIFTVATPFKNGWNNLEGSYQIIIKPSAADDPNQVGTPLTANVLVRVRGVYVPSLEPAVMLGALLGAALVARLSKQE